MSRTVYIRCEFPVVQAEGLWSLWKCQGQMQNHFWRRQHTLADQRREAVCLERTVAFLRFFANFWRIVIKQVYPLEVEIQFIWIWHSLRLIEVLLIQMMNKNPVQGIKTFFYDGMCYWDSILYSHSPTLKASIMGKHYSF